MTDLRISPVRDKDEMLEFIHFPWEVYKDDPYWVPPLLSDKKKDHDQEHNPFFQHATVEYFLARRGSKVVGTIAAFTDHAYNEFQGVNNGFFGFFEVLDDAEAAAALLATAEKWAKEVGHETILGPAQYSINVEIGLLIDGFDDSPRVLMTYNPPRYMGYLDSAGFYKAMDLFAYEVDLYELAFNSPPKLVRVLEKVKRRRNLKIRAINMKDLDREIENVKRILNSSWERNWGFVPYTDAEINLLVENLKQLVDPDLVLLVENEGEVVGFALNMPDLNAPLRLAYPRPGKFELLTLLAFIWHWKVRKRFEWIRMLLLGVLPEFQGMGIDGMLYLETAKRGYAKGIKKIEGSWVLETNEKMRRAVEYIGGEVYKTYRMYEKRL